MVKVGDPEWRYKRMLKKEKQKIYKLYKAQLITWDECSRRIDRIKKLRELP